MGIFRFSFRSQELCHYVDTTIVIPTDSYSYSRNVAQKDMEARTKYLYPGIKYQTVYLIHGGGDDDSLTYRYTNAERYAEENNVMLVTPNIANSFGVDTEYGVKYQSFLSRELPIVIQSLFPSYIAREDNFIVGYAMGGNVALGTAILHPEMFCECVDISGGIGMTLDRKKLQDELKGDFFRENFCLYNTSFGDAIQIPNSKKDIYTAAKRDVEKNLLPKMHLLCGSREFIRERVESDARILQKLGACVDYRVMEGYDHNFHFWDEAIRLTLAEILPLKRYEHASESK